MSESRQVTKEIGNFPLRILLICCPSQASSVVRREMKANELAKDAKPTQAPEWLANWCIRDILENARQTLERCTKKMRVKDKDSELDDRTGSTAMSEKGHKVCTSCCRDSKLNIKSLTNLSQESGVGVLKQLVKSGRPVPKSTTIPKLTKPQLTSRPALVQPESEDGSDLFDDDVLAVSMSPIQQIDSPCDEFADCDDIIVYPVRSVDTRTSAWSKGGFIKLLLRALTLTAVAFTKPNQCLGSDFQDSTSGNSWNG